MKVGKAFKNQKVPEWTEAYVDYNGLKHILQEIRRLKQCKQPPTPLRAAQQREFSGLNLQASNSRSSGDIEDQVIAVNTVQEQNSRKLYNTKFLLSLEEGGENEKIFFKELDDELNPSKFKLNSLRTFTYHRCKGLRKFTLDLPGEFNQVKFSGFKIQ